MHVMVETLAIGTLHEDCPDCGGYQVQVTGGTEMRICVLEVDSSSDERTRRKAMCTCCVCASGEGMGAWLTLIEAGVGNAVSF